MVKKQVKKWARDYNKCVVCGSTKRKHRARGLCEGCYSGIEGCKIRAEQRERVNIEHAKPLVKHRGRPTEWTEERIEQEAKDLIKWSEQTDVLVLEEFGLYREPPYIRAVMYKLAEKNDNFRNALLIAKERIRSRRESGATLGKYNASCMQFTHGFYDRDNQDKNQSFTSYKDDRKKVTDVADINKQKQALTESKQFVEEAKKNLKKKKKIVKSDS